MSGSGDFSVVTASALVLGGLAAIALAVAVASTKPTRREAAGAAGADAVLRAPLTPDRAVGQTEVEYSLESDDVLGAAAGAAPSR